MPTMSAETKSFDLAHVGVSIRVSGPGSLNALATSYDQYARPASTPDRLAIEVSFDEQHSSPPSNAPYPAFDMRADGDDLLLWRADASGRLSRRADGTVHATFTAHSDVVLEAVVRITLATTLLFDGGLMMHAASAEIDGGAMLFSGPSGAGKSTISDLLAENGDTKLTDELVALRPVDGVWRAFVMPFFGHPRLPFGRVAPVRAVHFISHAEGHHRDRLSSAHSLQGVLRNTVAYAGTRELAAALLANATALVEAVPCFALQFARSPTVGSIVRQPLDEPAVHAPAPDLVVGKVAD